MPLQHRHGYAAGLHRGLPTGDITQPGVPPNVTAGARCNPAQIRQVRAGGSLEGRSAAGSSRTPFRLACRTRTIWQCWPVPSLSGLLSTLPRAPGSGCPQQQAAPALGVVVLVTDDGVARAFVPDLDQSKVVALVGEDANNDVPESHAVVGVANALHR